MKHRVEDLIRLFNDSVGADERTRLVRGEAEPLYRPWRDEVPAELIFAHGFFASGLHEIAHWCIAGRRRRWQVDFGYWYQPDGRSPEQQAAFERVEARPQAVEWLLHEAAGTRFHVSIDNLAGDGAADEAGFRTQVLTENRRYWRRGFPPRAWRFAGVLADFYGRVGSLAPERFASLPA